jgi:hypothetical protein
MNWNLLNRQTHRWVSIIFTAIVASIFISLGIGVKPQWVYYMPLLPLAFLVLTGLYMFFYPYITTRRVSSNTSA